MGYTLASTVHAGFDNTLQRTRDALAEQGFGVLTEIDIRATLKAKIGVDTPPQVILGACRPPLAHAALQVEPSVGVLLPCNVVVRSLNENRTAVEAMDPTSMVQLTGNNALSAVAADARDRLTRTLEALTADDTKAAGHGHPQP